MNSALGISQLTKIESFIKNKKLHLYYKEILKNTGIKLLSPSKI